MIDLDLFKLEYENRIEEDVDSAIMYCKEVLLKSDNSYIYLYLGEAQMANDCFEEAIESINKAIEYGCLDKELAYSLKGEALFYSDRYMESRLAFNEVLKLNEYSFFASVYIIDIDIYEGKYLEAITTIDKLLTLGELTIEDLAFLETKKGWILLRYLEMNEKAFKLFKEAIKKDISCGTAYVGLGYYYIYIKDYENSISNFNIALNLGEAYELVYEGLDKARERLGDKVV